MNQKVVKPSAKFIRSRKEKIKRMSILCYKNSLRLHSDSICLYQKKRYPSAYALSIIALEEMGKYMFLSHGLFYEYFNTGDYEDFVSGVLKDTYSHRIKQKIFLNFNFRNILYRDIVGLKKRNIDGYELFYQTYLGDAENQLDNPAFTKYFPNVIKYYERLKTLETKKQDSLYVGYPRKKGGDADFEKKLNSPFKIGRKNAEEQITLLNDHILLQALQVLKGISDFEEWEDELDFMINSRFVKQLRKNWPKFGKHNKTLILELSKMPDDKLSDEN